MKSDKPNAALLAFASLITCVTWPLAAMLWFRHGERALGISLFGLGLSLGPCLAAYAIVPRARKQKARSVVLFMGGFCIMAFSLLGRVNLDMEGFFMLVFAGTVGAAIGHNLVTVIVGPMLFGRLLCGWGCWRSMVLELLPICRSQGRRRGRWTFLAFVGLAATVGGGVVWLGADSPGERSLRCLARHQCRVANHRVRDLLCGLHWLGLRVERSAGVL